MKIRLPDYLKIVTEDERVLFHAAKATYHDVSVLTDLRGDALEVSVTADETPVRYVMLRFNFRDDEKRDEPVRVLGDTIERSYGDMEWRGIVPERVMMWTCAVSNGSDRSRDFTGRFTECFGVKVRPNALCSWQYDTEGVTLWVDLRCGGSGVHLAGRTIDACTVCFGEYREMSAFDALCRYYRSLCDDPLPVKDVIYGSNNWYYAYGNSSAEQILADADLLAELTAGVENRPFMVIDDGWQPNSCDAPWNRGNERFPDMKKLAEEIASRDLIPGIWVRYLADRKHDLHTPDSWRSPLDKNILDVSHPQVLAYIRTVTQQIVDWGYRLIKHDYSSFDVLGYDILKRREENNVKNGWHFYDTSKTTAEILKNYYRTILEAADGKAYILGCNVVGHLSAGLCHANRIGDDTSGYDFERCRYYGVNALAFRLPQNRAFFVADADCVGHTGYIDWTLNREWLRLVSVSGSSLFLSCDPEIPTDEQKEDMRLALRQNSTQSDELIPVDWMENTIPEKYLLNGKEVSFRWYQGIGSTHFEDDDCIVIEE